MKGFKKNRTTLEIFNDRYQAGNLSKNGLNKKIANDKDGTYRVMFGITDKTIPNNNSNQISKKTLQEKVEQNKRINVQSNHRDMLEGFRGNK